MHYKSLLFSFEGRINRARYWLAALIILCCMVFSLLLLSVICLVFGFGGPVSINLVGLSASVQLGGDDNATSFIPQSATSLMTVAFGWCYAAVSIKRLHDRNKSSWWVLPYIVASGLFSHFGGRLGDSWASAFIELAVYVAFVWGLVELYCLKGTLGPNRFGSDPLPKVQTRPRGEPRGGLRTAAGWDQHAELQFVPHSAGPSAGAHVMRGHD